MRLFIDANIPMYWAGGPSLYKESCGRILAAAASGEIEAVTSSEVLQEILYRYTAIARKDLARSVFDTFHVAVTTVLPVTEDDVLLARRLHEAYDLRPRDLIHAAVMLNSEITEICSADSDFDQIEGIHRIDPLTWPSGD